MEETHYLQTILIFLTAAIVFVSLSKFLRLSSVFGYLIAGIVIGPFGLSLIQDSHTAAAISELGVLFLLFTIGLELSLERLVEIKKYLLGLGSLQLILTAIAIGGVTYSLGISLELSIIIGWSLSLSSTALVLRLLIDNNEQTTKFGRISISVLLFQDLAVVPLLILIPVLEVENVSLISALGGASIKAMIAITIIVILGRLALRPVYKIISSLDSPELLAATTLLIVLGTGWITYQAGLSMTLGAFLAGLILSETEYRHQVEADIKPFRGFLLGLFFISVGMLLDLELLRYQIVDIVLLALSIIFIKTLIITLISIGFKIPIHLAIKVGLLLSQAGEFAFIVFGKTLQIGYLPEILGQVLIATVVITMIITPFLSIFGEKLYNWVNKKFEPKFDGEDYDSIDMNCQVFIAGFGRIGRSIARVLNKNSIPYIVLDLDTTRIFNYRKKGYPVYYGDASNIEILQAIGIEKVKTVIITIKKIRLAEKIVSELRERYPDLTIAVRAHDRKHSINLLKAGATSIAQETVETSLQLSAITLNSLGFNDENIKDTLEKYREDNYALLDEIASEEKKTIQDS